MRRPLPLTHFHRKKNPTVSSSIFCFLSVCISGYSSAKIYCVDHCLDSDTPLVVAAGAFAAVNVFDLRVGQGGNRIREDRGQNTRNIEREGEDDREGGKERVI